MSAFSQENISLFIEAWCDRINGLSHRSSAWIASFSAKRLSFLINYGSDREVQYGVSEGISADMLTHYAKTEEKAVPVSAGDLSPVREDLIGYVAAAAPARELDLDGDGRMENVYDFPALILALIHMNWLPEPFICRKSLLNWHLKSEK